MNKEILQMFERVDLGFFPTPLTPLPNLTRVLAEKSGGRSPFLWVKRDDCTGLGGGGNKTRKLEFLLADAKRQGCNVLVTVGALQSNHARQTAAAAAKCGMRAVLLLTDRVANRSPAYRKNGNVLLDELFGADVRIFPATADMDEVVEQTMTSLREHGEKPYYISLGGSSAIGALGYVEAMRELASQATAQGIRIDHVVTASGSGGTQAGMLVGASLYGLDCSIEGISVSKPASESRRIMRELVEAVRKLVMTKAESSDEKDISLQLQHARAVQAVIVDDGFIGHAYGQPTPAMIEAVRLVAKLEGLLLDPVYTGKAMAGLLEHAMSGRYAPTDNLVFWHTGGSQSLFAYDDVFCETALCC